MKIIHLLLAICFISSMSFAQNAPIDFETDGHGADWTWIVDDNTPNPPLEIIANPVSGGLNTSGTVAKFTALPPNPNWWALCYSDNVGPFTITEDNKLFKVLIYKPNISPVGLKFEVGTNGVVFHEIMVSNTVTNQWEELTFDFSAIVGNGITYTRITFIPDFTSSRPTTRIIYFDNITFSDDDPTINNVYGTLTYDNTDNTLLLGETVKLMQGATEIASTTTDGTGNYYFADVPNGNYTVVPVVTLDWKGVTATDATHIRRHVANTILLTDLRLTSADVNSTSTVTVADITPILQRIVTTISSFPSGDWAYSNGDITVAGVNVCKNIRAICYGDVNASYNFGAKSLNEINVDNNEILFFDDYQSFEIPVKVNSDILNLTSLTINLEYNSELIELNEVVMAQNNNSLVYNISDNILRMAYSNLDATDYSNGDVLFYLRGNILELSEPNAINVSISGELADANDDVLSDIGLGIPQISSNDFTQISDVFYNTTIYPNPANSFLNVQSKVYSVIEIIDVFGKVLKSIELNKGEISIDLSNYPNGIYLVRINAEGRIHTERFSILK